MNITKEQAKKHLSNLDENDFTLVKSITQGENLFEHKNGCLYIVEYEEVDDEEIHDFDNPTLYMDKDGNKVF